MHSTEVMTTIKLSGSLAKIFGREHKRLITTTQEAIRALCATLPGFEKYLNTSKSRGLTFSIFRGNKILGKTNLCSQLVVGKSALCQLLWEVKGLVYYKLFWVRY